MLYVLSVRIKNLNLNLSCQTCINPSLVNWPPSLSLALQTLQTADTQGIPRLDSLRMTEEEERDFNSFSLAPVTVPQRSWRAHEDLKDLRSHSQAHDVSNTSQTRPVITQVIVQAQSTRSRSVQPIRDQIRLGNQSRTSL